MNIDVTIAAVGERLDLPYRHARALLLALQAMGLATKVGFSRRDGNAGRKKSVWRLSERIALDFGARAPAEAS